MGATTVGKVTTRQGCLILFVVAYKFVLFHWIRKSGGVHDIIEE
jgi:hypothetical protein